MDETLKALKKEWKEIFTMIGVPISEDIDTEALDVSIEDLNLSASNTFFLLED